MVVCSYEMMLKVFGHDGVELLSIRLSILVSKLGSQKKHLLKTTLSTNLQPRGQLYYLLPTNYYSLLSSSSGTTHEPDKND